MTNIDQKPIQLASLTPTQKGFAASNALQNNGAKSNAPKEAKAEDKFSFWDLVDIINPLQHIPVVNTIYREITGDKINNVSRIAGGALFGGFIGAAIGGVNAIAVNETGDDLGGLAMAKMGFKDSAKKEVANIKVEDNIPTVTVNAMKQSDKSLLRATDHETIIWDDEKPAVQEVAKAKESFDPLIEKPSAQVAAAPAAAMPSPKDLNDLEPGNAASPVPQQVANTEVPATMMKALAKYQSMQRLGDPKAEAVPVPGQVQPTRKFAGLEKNVRRY